MARSQGWSRVKHRSSIKSREVNDLRPCEIRGWGDCAVTTAFPLFLRSVGLLKFFLILITLEFFRIKQRSKAGIFKSNRYTLKLFGLSRFLPFAGNGAPKKHGYESGKLSLSEKAGKAFFFSAFVAAGGLFSFESPALPTLSTNSAARRPGGEQEKLSPAGGSETTSQTPAENSPPKGWKKADLFSGAGQPQIFVSDGSPEIIASVSRALRRGAPLPKTEQAFQIQEEQKRRALQKIPSLSQWTPEFYSWDTKNKTLFLKGFLIRRGKTVFFKEWHFYYEAHIIQILMESPEYLPADDRRVVRFLKYIRENINKEGLR